MCHEDAAFEVGFCEHIWQSGGMVKMETADELMSVEQLLLSVSLAHALAKIMAGAICLQGDKTVLKQCCIDCATETLLQCLAGRIPNGML